MAWYTEGVKTDPSTGVILADSGPLSVSGTFSLVSYATNYGKVEIQHRNAANNTTLDSQLLFINAGAPATTVSIPIALSMDERIRVVMAEDLTGNIQISLFK